MSRSKHVVITGVSRGLGRAMVEGFVSLGWTVSGCCRSSDAVEELRRAYPAPHAFSQVDVGRDAEVEELCAGILASHGTPDLLINNAAIINRSVPVWELNADEVANILDVNVKGTIAMIRGLAPAMIAQGGGVVVNFSSGWGRSTSPEVASYCATKWAIEGLSQAMAQETGGKLAVVALNPGIIDTEMLRSCFGDSAGSYPDAAAWARRAVPFIAGLSSRDNGKSLTAP
ncbi:SDR family oxidoreductase [Verrucomicrobium spinosum]|uniref:SDR family oxidoreductase n=1 Tax=Verrucomicrobium spinosum TaxID=2736 RepID=UPI00017469A1|nr:SDR family oxidoreductase [Verrucomicrobium spinosum]